MKKLFKSTAFSIALVMIATAQAQQMNEHKHQASDKPKMQMGMNMSDKDMHMAHAKMKAMKEDVQAIKSERDPQKQREMMNKNIKWLSLGDIPSESDFNNPTSKEVAIGKFKKAIASDIFEKFTIESRN